MDVNDCSTIVSRFNPRIRFIIAVEVSDSIIRWCDKFHQIFNPIIAEDYQEEEEYGRFILIVYFGRVYFIPLLNLEVTKEKDMRSILHLILAFVFIHTTRNWNAPFHLTKREVLPCVLCVTKGSVLPLCHTTPSHSVWWAERREA